MKRIVLLMSTALLLGACGFEETTPEDIFFTVSGSEGTPVQVVLSTRFVAGVNEAGVTEVSLNVSDTLLRTLPLDTIVSIRVDQRFFAEVLPLEGDSLAVRLEVQVDDRPLVDRMGLVLREPPFRYVYLFNQRYTSAVDVVF